MSNTTFARRSRVQNGTTTNSRNEIIQEVFCDQTKGLFLSYKPEKGTYCLEILAAFKGNNGWENGKARISIIPWIGSKNQPKVSFSRDEVITLVSTGFLKKTVNSARGERSTVYAFNSLTFRQQTLTDEGGVVRKCYKWSPTEIWTETVNVAGPQGHRAAIVINWKLVMSDGLKYVIPNCLPPFFYEEAGQKSEVRFNLDYPAVTAIANAAGMLNTTQDAELVIEDKYARGFNLKSVFLQIDQDTMADVVSRSRQYLDSVEDLTGTAKIHSQSADPKIKEGAWAPLNKLRREGLILRIDYSPWRDEPEETDLIRLEPAQVIWGGTGGINKVGRQWSVPVEWVPYSQKFARMVGTGTYTPPQGNTDIMESNFGSDTHEENSSGGGDFTIVRNDDEEEDIPF